MKRMDFRLPYYKVDITLLQIESEKDTDEVSVFLNSMNIENAEYTIERIKQCAVNGGDTYRDLNHRRIVVLFFPMEDNTRRAEVYSHEKRHIEDRVIEFFGVNDVESSALLAGFLGERFYEFWKTVTN